MKQRAFAFPRAKDSMPQHIWSKFKSILPRRSRDPAPPPAIVGSSSDQSFGDEAASEEPSIRVFYADGPCAGLDITTVAFSRDLSNSGITSYPVFVVRNLDITPEEEDPSLRLDAGLRLSVDPYSTGSNSGLGSTYVSPSQDLSDPRITLSSMLCHNGQNSGRGRVSGFTNYQDSGSRQSVNYRRIGAPQRKGTPPLLFGTRQMKSVDSDLGGLGNAKTTAFTNSTYVSTSQDLSDPRITLSSTLCHNGQNSGRSRVQDSGSRQSVNDRIGAPQRKGTPPLLFGTRQMKSVDSNLGGLGNAKTTAFNNSTSVTQAIPIAIRLPRFDTQLMDMDVCLLKKQLSKLNTDGVYPSILHAKQDKLLFEALCDKMPVAIYEPRPNLIDDLLLPLRPKPVAIISKRLQKLENFSATDY